MPSNLIGILGIGASSLATQQAGVTLSGNNISNANTKGYSRRTLTIDPGTGNGAVAIGAARAEDFILSQQLAAQQGALSMADRSASGMGALESVFSAGQAGTSSLSTAVSNLAQAFSQLTASPSDLTRRTAVIEQARAVAVEFNRAGAQLDSLAASNTSSALDLVPSINSAAAQIASLNQAILAAPPSAVAASNSMDERDRQAQSLADIVGGQLIRNNDGSYDVLVAGQALVHGSHVEPLAVNKQADGTLQVTVGGKAVAANAVGGQLGGMIQTGLVNLRMQQQIDQLAFDLSSAINAQHSLGVGLDGNGGRPLFAPLAGPQSAAISMSVNTSLTASQVAAGFTGAPGDNGNAVALASLIDQPVLDGGRSNFQNFYSSIVSTLGYNVQLAQQQKTVASSVQSALSAQQQSIIGVSTDEEMTQVLAYQRAFDASSRFVQTVDQMLLSLVSIAPNS